MSNKSDNLDSVCANEFKKFLIEFVLEYIFNVCSNDLIDTLNSSSTAHQSNVFFFVYK